MNALCNLIGYRCAWRVLHISLFYLAFCGTIVAQAAEEPPPKDDWFTAYFVDGYGLFVVFVVAIVALLIFRQMRCGRAFGPLVAKAPPRVQATAQPAEVTPELRKVAPTPTAREVDTKERATPREPASADYSKQAFGAYRIDQEVGKLVLGKGHRMDVLASRVPEDRRAIEASLIKSLASSDSDNEGRERARRALEDYGFVARESALLLEGRDAWERSSAARVLGQIGSAASLHALIEALHDGDSVVRNQAVTSLGQLKQPAAIGALLDVGRRYSDIPPSLLSETLSSCSIEDLSFLDSTAFDLDEPITGSADSVAGVEPLMTLEGLPTGDEDDALLGHKLDNVPSVV